MPEQDPEYVRSLEEEVARLRKLALAAEAQKNDALTRLAAGFSHDVNNFMTPMLAYSSMIKEEMPPGHPAIEYVNEILDATEKMQQFIKLMQDIRAKGSLTGSLTVNTAVSAAIEAFRPHVPSGVNLTVRLDPSVKDAQGDRAAIERCVTELMGNAVHAMPVGGDLTVSTIHSDLEKETPMDGSMAPPGAYVIIAVTDQGAGMAPEVRERMYEPYFSARPGQAKGLGLSMVRGLVRRCGGHIRCASAFGEGTRFEIFLRQTSHEPEDHQ